MTARPAQTLGQRLSAWRVGRQMSLSAAARRLGVHPTTFQRWEEGRRPYPRHLEAIADALGADLATVTALAGPAPRRPPRPATADAPVLVRARLEAGLDRVELGRALHVGPATVYQWERGNTRPPENLLPHLARQLGLGREELHLALADHPPCRYDGEVLPGLGVVLRERGWTRAEVRDLLEVASSTVFAWETGRTRVPSWALRRLATACGTEVAELTSCGRRRVDRPASGLAGLRRRIRMTQREAAAVLGVSTSSLSRYETGRRPVAVPLARGMARVYRVPLARVFAAAGLASHLLLTQQWTAAQLPAILADLRQAAGASMSEVARHTGVSHPTVRRWESGESMPSAGALATLELQYQLGRGRLTALAKSGQGRADSASRSSIGSATASRRPIDHQDDICVMSDTARTRTDHPTVTLGDVALGRGRGRA